MSVILPTLEKQFNLSDADQEILGSILFLGIFIGSVIAGFLSDRMGRRKLVLYTSICQFIFGIISAFVSAFSSFVVLRGILGIMIGGTIPIMITYVTEISPSSKRGKGQVYIQAFFVFGMIYAMLCASIFLQDLETGNWRAVLVMGSLPALVVFAGAVKYLKESPRFLIATDKIVDGVQVLN